MYVHRTFFIVYIFLHFTLYTASDVDWSVICVSETCLKQNQVSSFVLEGYNVFASCREDSEGGGSMMYVNKLYDAKERKDLESKFIQTTFVELRLASLNKNIIIETIYKPPNYQ